MCIAICATVNSFANVTMSPQHIEGECEQAILAKTMARAKEFREHDDTRDDVVNAGGIVRGFPLRLLRGALNYVLKALNQHEKSAVYYDDGSVPFAELATHAKDLPALEVALLKDQGELDRLNWRVLFEKNRMDTSIGNDPQAYLEAKKKYEASQAELKILQEKVEKQQIRVTSFNKAIAEVEGWIARYSEYPQDLEKLFQEFASLRERREALQRMLAEKLIRQGDFPIELEVPKWMDDNHIEVQRRSIADYLSGVVSSRRIKSNESTLYGTYLWFTDLKIFDSGKIRERKLEQAKLHERLKIVQEYLRAAEEGAENVETFALKPTLAATSAEPLLVRLNRVLTDNKLTPHPLFDSVQKWHEVWAEMKSFWKRQNFASENRCQYWMKWILMRRRR